MPISESKVWWIKGQAYFRQWYLILNVCCLILWIILLPYSSLFFIAVVLLSIVCYLCFVDVIPFSILYPSEIKSIDSKVQTLSILIYNVKEDNDRYEDLIELQHTIRPTLLLLLETNHKWDNALREVEKHYLDVVKEIREDTYGMMLLSRLTLKEEKIHYLSHDEIPSIDVVFDFCGREIQFLGLHPKPPIPGEALTSKQKDQEFEAAAQKLIANKDKYLQIVAGDLNDVVWSRTSKKFKKKTGLKDPRVGRGIFSTFPTYFPVRFPLDQILCSPSFMLIKIERRENIGSDHYPILVEFSL